MKLIHERRKESSMHKNQVRKKKKNRLTKIDSIIPEISRSRVKSGWQIPSERARANLHVADKTSPRRVGWRKPFKLFASRHWKLSKMTMKGRSVLSVRGRKKKKKKKKDSEEKPRWRNRDEKLVGGKVRKTCYDSLKASSYLLGYGFNKIKRRWFDFFSAK